MLRHAFTLPLLLAATLAANPVAVVDDDFADGNPLGSPAHPFFWNIQAVGQGDNGIFENNGYLTLLAATRPYSFAGLNTRLDDRLNFFRNVVSITVEDFIHEHRNMPPKEAMFRLSLNSTEKRQTIAPQSISLRFVPGVAFLGFKTQAVGKMDAENILGDRKGSLVHELYDGRLVSFNLTLDPFVQPGAIAYSLSLYTDGSRGVISRQGLMSLRPEQWSPDGRSALILESRRNIAEELPDSYVSVSIGRILVTSSPRP